MAYIVQAEDPDGAVSKTIADRKDALATAVNWASEGRSNVKIIGNGRIYTAMELALAIINDHSG
jgi:hypothetical protein